MKDRTIQLRRPGSYFCLILKSYSLPLFKREWCAIIRPEKYEQVLRCCTPLSNVPLGRATGGIIFLPDKKLAHATCLDIRTME